MKALPILALCAIPALSQTPLSNPHNTEADRKAGALMFRSHCAPCHGVKGTGGLGPDLTTGRFFHGDSDADLYRNIGEGIPGTAMPGAFFDGTQVWQIAAFVRSLSQSVSPSGNESALASKTTGNPARGEQLFRTKGCIGCHLVRGEGGVKGPDLSLIGSQRSPENLEQSIVDPNAKVAPEFWVAKIITRDGQSRAGFVMNKDTYMVQILDFSAGLMSIPRSEFKDFAIDRSSIMPSFKEQLSGTELNDLVSYLSSLKRESLKRTQEKSE